MPAADPFAQAFAQSHLLRQRQDPTYRPSYFDLLIAPQMAQQYAHGLQRLSGVDSPGASAIYNPGYWSNDIGQAELQRKREYEQSKQAASNLDAYEQQALIGELLNPSPITSAGAVEQIKNVGEEPRGEPFRPPGSAMVRNPYFSGGETLNPHVPGIDTSEEGQAMADAFAPALKTRRREMVSDLVQIGKALQGAAPYQVRDAQAQFMRKYPESRQLGLRPRPLTSDQVKELKSDIQFSEQQSQINEFASRAAQGDFSQIPLVRGKNGEPTVPDGVSEIFRAITESRLQESQQMQKAAATEKGTEREFDFRMQQLKNRYAVRAEQNPNEEGSQGFRVYETHLQKRYAQEQRMLYKQTYEGAPILRPFAELEQIATQKDTPNIVIDEQDYDALPPGTPFIDPNGVRRIKGR